MSDRSVVIVAARRTPIGSFQGQFASASAVDLGAAAIEGAVQQSGVEGPDLSEVIMGCVLPAGLGQAPARQASLQAGIPVSVGCMTINKVCGSGLKAVMLGHDAIRAGASEIVVAGGMESMTNAPYLLPKARAGLRMGHGKVIDHMFWDGLQSPYDQQMMGMFGEMCAEKYAFSRVDQDGFAIASVERAQRAVHEGDFVDEIVPVTVKVRRAEHTYAEDEEPHRCNIGKSPTLRPAFKPDGSVTAGNASKISDGEPAGRWTRSTCSKSTRPSLRSRWPRWPTTDWTTTRST
jgi:acetyl-CoA C-acetyltransferase